jgi:hypothetical protein
MYEALPPVISQSGRAHGYRPGVSVIWTLVLAAVTSLLTTVVVEYVARPSLEARKARMLRAQDAFLALTGALDRLAYLFLQLPTRSEVQAKPLVAPFRRTRITELVKAADAADEALTRLPIVYVVKHGSHIGRTAQVLGYMRAALLDLEEDGVAGDDALRETFDGFEYIRVYFEIYPTIRDPRQNPLARWFWRRTQRRRYVSEAQRFVDGLGRGKRDSGVGPT